MNIEDIARSATLCGALANPTRLKLIWRVLDGEVKVADLALLVELSPTATSHHLGVLRKAGLVDMRRDAQKVYYRCRSSEVRQLLATLREVLPAAAANAPPLRP